MGTIRLLQLLQRQAGVSRRRARALIEAGRVRLDGRVVSAPFLELDPARVRSLELDGRPVDLRPPEPGIYAFYKPRGMLCSRRDPHHRHAMGKILRKPELRGYNVAGRLDRDAEGLVLLTNDGALLHRLTHPRFGVEKVYHVVVPQLVRFRQAYDAFRQMRHGIRDAEERLRIVRGRLVRRAQAETVLELVLSEGRKHEVKRLCRHFGWPVARLIRVELAGVRLGQMRPGQLRPLSRAERRALEAHLTERS